MERSPLWSGADLLAFEARGPTDFDWIEQKILATSARDGTEPSGPGARAHPGWPPSSLRASAREPRPATVAAQGPPNASGPAHSRV